MNSFILLNAAASGASGGMGGILMLVAIFVVFYFFMIRPQQKRQKEIRKFRESLGRGAKVVTAGGILGTIEDVTEKYFVVEITKGVQIRVDKGSVYPSAEDANMANQQNEGK